MTPHIISAPLPGVSKKPAATDKFQRFLPREARKRGLPVSEPRPIPPNTTGRRDAGGGSRVQNQSEIDPKYSIISYLLVYLYPEISKNNIKGSQK